MQFPNPLIRGTLIQRYKRFLADVKLDDGKVVTAHCANPGSMMGLKEPGSTVWLSPATNPKRKLKFSWELVEVDPGDGVRLVGINTALPNQLVADAIGDGTIKELQGYDGMRREVKYGKNSRIDILLECEEAPSCYVEVKNVHMMRKPKRAEFPDSVTARGTKHLAELSDMVAEGHRAVMVYLVQYPGAKSLSFARDIDPIYGAAFDNAIAAGVEAISYVCRIDETAITVDTSIKILDLK